MWGCTGISIPGADGVAIGTGYQNSLDLANACPMDAQAALYCLNYMVDGYDDWFLPSKDELNEMLVHLHQNGFGGFENATYWSSTEISSISAWAHDFGGGFSGSNLKGMPNRVRAIRVF